MKWNCICTWVIIGGLGIADAMEISQLMCSLWMSCVRRGKEETMKMLMKVIALAVFICSSSTARADTVFRADLGEYWGIGWIKGKPKAQEPGSFLGFGVVQDIAKFGEVELKFSADVLIAVPHTTFHAAPRFVPGLILKKGWFAFGGSLFYQWNPPYKGKDAHLVGVTIGPAFSITKEIKLAFAIGYRAVLGGGPDVVHCLAFGPTVYFKLPF